MYTWSKNTSDMAARIFEHLGASLREIRVCKCVGTGYTSIALKRFCEIKLIKIYAAKKNILFECKLHCQVGLEINKTKETSLMWSAKRKLTKKLFIQGILYGNIFPSKVSFTSCCLSLAYPCFMSTALLLSNHNLTFANVVHAFWQSSNFVTFVWCTDSGNNLINFLHRSQICACNDHPNYTL